MKKRPPIKFSKALCGTSYVMYRGICVTVSKQGSRWTASCLVRDNFRFVAHDRLEGHRCSSKTKQDATRYVIAGLACLAHISPDFAAFIGTMESEEEFHQDAMAESEKGQSPGNA